MSRKLDLVNAISVKLQGAAGIVDLARCVSAQGNKAAYSNGLADEAMAWALFTAYDLIKGAMKDTDELHTITNIGPGEGPVRAVS